MLRFTTVMGAFLIFLVVAPMISGCAMWEAKMREAELSMLPWADDKEIMLESCPGCFHLGPLDYDAMVLALAGV